MNLQSPIPAANPRGSGGPLIRDRIKDFRRVLACDLLPNPKNWRTHPPAQQAALRAVLAEVGYADACLCRELPDGRLMLIDGHLRAETSRPDQEMPVFVLDVTEAEADKLLLSLDPLAAMAGANSEALDSLLRDVQTGSQDLAAMLTELADANGLLPATDGSQDLAAMLTELADANGLLPATDGSQDLAAMLTESAAPAEVDPVTEGQKLTDFIAAREKLRQTGKDLQDTDFWVCLVFDSREQKKEFLAQLPSVPVIYGMYANGEVFAEEVGRPVAKTASKPRTAIINKRLAKLVGC